MKKKLAAAALGVGQDISTDDQKKADTEGGVEKMLVRGRL